MLRGGAVQEEIMFITCPEMLVGILFCQFMQPNEAIYIIGAEKYCKYKGYSNKFQFNG